MQKIINYSFWLILLFLVLVYFKGATANISVLSSGVNSIINTLQGRDKNGQVVNYPN